jgi:hypothetical protein
VDHVELSCPFRNCFQQYSTGRVVIHSPSTEAQRSGPNRMKFAAGIGITAGEQGHVVTLVNKLIDQPSNDPFRTTI